MRLRHHLPLSFRCVSRSVVTRLEGRHSSPHEPGARSMPNRPQDTGSRPSAARTRRGRTSLRHARLASKLSLIVAVGVLATVVVAVVGLLGLGSAKDRGEQLADIAVTLQAGDELRDMEGDMRVNVYSVTEATTAEELQAAQAATKETDTTLDEAVAKVRAGISTDPVAI